MIVISCEEVVVIQLPEEQNLLVVEGWVTDIEQHQYVRLTRSNSFSGAINPLIEDATVMVQTNSGATFTYSYTENGTYLSDQMYAGGKEVEYRVRIILNDGSTIRSDWSTMRSRTRIVLLSVGSFEENDPDNPGLTKTVYFPRITARDSIDFENYYRWVLYKNDERLTEPESITLQNDRFFDGNFIPNLFDQFEYDEGDEMKVELHSINKDSYEFLNLLKSQITTLSAAASSTPAAISGNLFNATDPSQMVLGYFGTAAISIDSVVAE